MVDLDVYGIAKLNPTRPSGREWFSNWHTATNHNWTSTGTSNSNRDPQDSLVDLHCSTGCRAEVQQTTDTMLAGQEGAASNAWRIYINDPAGVWKWQPSVEMTVYFKATGTYSGGTVFVHCRLAGPTEHQLEFSCSASGHGYSFEIKRNETIQIRKELAHPAYADNIISNTADAPENVWVGMKLVLKVHPNGDVLIQGYRDMDDGANGGNWELMVEHLDTGDMQMNDETAINDFNDANSGAGGCTKVASRTTRLNFPATSCYLRMDNCIVQFKKFSVREIDVAATVPTSNVALQLLHSGGATNSDPLLDKGGLNSSVEVDYDSLDGTFLSATQAQLDSGLQDFRCHYIRNSHPTKTMFNIRAYIFKITQSLDDQILIGKADEGKNGVVAPIATTTTIPPNVEFVNPVDPTHALHFGDLGPLDVYGVWYERLINAGAASLPNNECLILFLFDINETGGGQTDPPDDPDTGVVMRYVVMGDMSCSSDGQKTMDAYKGKKLHLHVGNGDLAYKSGSECWISMVEKANIDGITKISFGNHDVDESESQPSTRNNLRQKFSLTKNYYSFTIQNTFWLVMDSENDPENDPQKSELEPLLKAASENPAIEWIFVCHHRPIYGPSSNHGNEGGVRDTWDPLFDKYRVDAVFTSHNHDCFVTKLIKYSGSSTPTVVASGGTYSYARGAVNHGKLYCGTGNAGRSHYGIGSVPSYVEFSNDSTYGYLYGEISDSGRKLTLTWFSNSNKVLKTVIVQHTGV